MRSWLFILLVSFFSNAFSAADLFDEQFETNPGYDETGWSELGAGADEDAPVSTCGSPSGWGSLALYINNTTYGYSSNASTAPTADIWYMMFEFVLDAHSMTTGSDNMQIGWIRGSGWSNILTLFLDHDGTNVDLRADIYHDGSSNSYYVLQDISLDTRYYFGLYWNVTDDEWAVRAGSSIPTTDTNSGSLTSTHDEHLQDTRHGAITGTKNVSICFDNIQVDDTEWPQSVDDSPCVACVLLNMGQL